MKYKYHIAETQQSLGAVSIAHQESNFKALIGWIIVMWQYLGRFFQSPQLFPGVYIISHYFWCEGKSVNICWEPF